ncbi:unnamed protein product [Pylaiella littoralis]
MTGVKEFGKRYGGRGYTAESSKRDPLSISKKSNFGQTKGETVAAARAREAAANEGHDAATTDEQKAAAKEKLNVAIGKRKLTVKARHDQSKGGENAIKKKKQDMETYTDDCSRGGQGGDRYKKSEGGGRSSGNRKGSEAAFEPFLQDAPGVALICAKDGCTQEWGKLLGVRRRNGGQPGVARGIYDEATKIVFVKEEKHRADKGQFRSKPGATVTKDGVVYSVRSTQPRYLNKVAHALRKTPA